MTRKEKELRQVLRILDAKKALLMFVQMLFIAIAAICFASGFASAHILLIICGFVFSGLFILVCKFFNYVNSASTFITLEIESSKTVMLDETEVAKLQKVAKSNFIKQLESFHIQ